MKLQKMITLLFFGLMLGMIVFCTQKYPVPTTPPENNLQTNALKPAP